MRGRRVLHRPPRFFHRTRYVAANGVRFEIAHAVDRPRFPLRELARSGGWFGLWLPVGVAGALVASAVVWSLLSWGWGL